MAYVKKTNYKSIYQDDKTGNYGVKYNYKVYNPITKKNEYKQKWLYGFGTIKEARQELAKLQANGLKQDNKDITLDGAFELWKLKAVGQDYSPVTINNTAEHLRMISQFLPLDTKMKDISENVYYKFCADIRQHGYSDETLRSLNATIRKLITLCYKRHLINDNILAYADNLRTKQKEDYKVITKEEFEEVSKYFKNNSFYRLGVNHYPKYRLLFNILYFTGIRLGECLALTYNDFEEFTYYSKKDNAPIRIAPSSNMGEHLQGMRLKITKSYVSDIKITKDPKNLKKRSIPLVPDVERLFMRIRQEHIINGGNLDDKIFDWTHGACAAALNKATEANGLRHYSCHDFRHTFISTLIKKNVPLPVIEKVSGDTQTTILKRYSHLFEQDEMLILKALQD